MTVQELMVLIEVALRGYEGAPQAAHKFDSSMSAEELLVYMYMVVTGSCDSPDIDRN